MKSVAIVFFALCAALRCFGINPAASRQEARESFGMDDVLNNIQQVGSDKEHDDSRLQQFSALLETAGIPVKDPESMEQHEKDVYDRIEALVGKSNARIITYIASIAEHTQSKSGNRPNASSHQASGFLLEQILAALEAQGSDFNFLKIEE
ncbi:hypothetical protein BBBOND_0207600 [Babesia bigemina]|uniref:Uncharacterized protein n=1 Tax=Babesia bigemina TaxID=5866 RepID=A0A061DCJ2_BABBI|nr:hypothetical protein BBBOND_0207600 [Babesia bigemina]CDR95605.1 hypothetical protein BBBOND_0207600 [Babesia bigemina]|eukprot:XP_012767791.1 hypothetical protein BBBOND_0207600 [Babesia bigemina]